MASTPWHWVAVVGKMRIPSNFEKRFTLDLPRPSLGNFHRGTGIVGNGGVTIRQGAKHDALAHIGIAHEDK